MRPELSNADFEDIWRDIDVDNSGTLSLGELEAFYGFNDGMSDDQIMEMLMVSARPRDPCDSACARDGPAAAARGSAARAAAAAASLVPVSLPSVSLPDVATAAAELDAAAREGLVAAARAAHALALSHVHALAFACAPSPQLQTQMQELEMETERRRRGEPESVKSKRNSRGIDGKYRPSILTDTGAAVVPVAVAVAPHPPPVHIPSTTRTLPINNTFTPRAAPTALSTCRFLTDNAMQSNATQRYAMPCPCQYQCQCSAI